MMFLNLICAWGLISIDNVLYLMSLETLVHPSHALINQQNIFILENTARGATEEFVRRELCPLMHAKSETIVRFWETFSGIVCLAFRTCMTFDADMPSQPVRCGDLTRQHKQRNACRPQERGARCPSFADAEPLLYVICRLAPVVLHSAPCDPRGAPPRRRYIDVRCTQEQQLLRSLNIIIPCAPDVFHSIWLNWARAALLRICAPLLSSLLLCYARLSPAWSLNEENSVCQSRRRIFADLN